jgi:hypothetical protein
LEKERDPIFTSSGNYLRLVLCSESLHLAFNRLKPDFQFDLHQRTYGRAPSMALHVVADVLSTFMVNDLSDPVQFLEVAGDLVATAAKAAKGKHSRVAACGECAPILWAQGKVDAAIQLERLWDEIMVKKYDVDTLCGYVLKSFQRQQESHVYERICAEHSAVYSG